MNKKNLIGRLGTVALIIGIPTAISIYQEKQRQEIIENPARTIEYSVVKGDTIDNLLRKYSNIPSSVDPRDVREYVKEINHMKTSGLPAGKTIIMPDYENKKGERK